MRKECPVKEKCGGCSYLSGSYEASLNAKQKLVEGLLKPFVKPEQIIGMSEPYYYRNKIHTTFKSGKGRDIISGVYEEGTHRVVPVESCLIEDEEGARLAKTVRRLLPSFKLLPYDEDRHTGFLRHIMVRVAQKTGEIMLVLVTGTNVFPGKNNFIKALRKEHPELTTIIWNINNKDTSLVLGDREEVLFGKGYIIDELCGMTFKISSRSFYQVNPLQTAILYGKALEYAGLTGKERVFDAYSGIGTIGMLAAPMAKEVLSVELNPDAVRDAKENAKHNRIDKISFYRKDAGVFMTEMADRGEKIDVLIMDPPRSGSDKKFIDAIGRLKPQRIVYVSCNPETLARDIKDLQDKGYKCETAVPVDMFPWTKHVETVALLSKLSEAKHHIEEKSADV